MGDHPGFIATNPCHTYKSISTNRSSPCKQKKQLMAIVAGLKLKKKFTIYYIVKNKRCFFEIIMSVYSTF